MLSVFVELGKEGLVGLVEFEVAGCWVLEQEMVLMPEPLVQWKVFASEEEEME